MQASRRLLTRIMGVQKTIIREGSGPSPQKGDRVTMEYTGWLRTADGGKGKQFDSSVGRGDFETPIGVGRVIKGNFCHRRLTGSNESNMDLKAGMRVSFR